MSPVELFSTVSKTSEILSYLSSSKGIPNLRPLQAMLVLRSQLLEHLPADAPSLEPDRLRISLKIHNLQLARGTLLMLRRHRDATLERRARCRRSAMSGRICSIACTGRRRRVVHVGR